MSKFSKATLTIALVTMTVTAGLVTSANAQATRSRYKLDSVQGMLSVQALDGWLLVDRRGNNRIAIELVNPQGQAQHQWFYFIPATGQPAMVIHRDDASRFTYVVGKKLTYTGPQDLKPRLQAMLRGASAIAMEYAPRSSITSLTRVDGATVQLIQSLGVQVDSSANLVQFTKALWQPKGRIAHYVAAHHVAKLKDQALRFIARRIAAGQPVTEAAVKRLLQDGYRIRGLKGPAPVVAVGRNTANPNYVTSDSSFTAIKRGDLVMLTLAAVVAGAERPIYADFTWMAYVGDTVPSRFADPFKLAVTARDVALKLVTDNAARKRVTQGYLVDRAARQVVQGAGMGRNFVQRTGHSLDTSLYGDGANLDDLQASDRRTLVAGSGFTIEPGLFTKGDFGVRAGVNVYMGANGVEVTTPTQQAITPIFSRTP